MARSGSSTRLIGRAESEASPTKRETKACVPTSPMASRQPVPALPKSSGASGSRKPPTPSPLMCHFPSRFSTRAPSACIARPVASTSSPSSRPSTTVSPIAMAPNMKARCEMDLSPGTRKAPVRPSDRVAVSGRDAVVSAIVSGPVRVDRPRLNTFAAPVASPVGREISRPGTMSRARFTRMIALFRTGSAQSN